MAILDLTNDVLPFLKLSADDSFGNVDRTMDAVEEFVKTYCDRTFESDTYEEEIHDHRGGIVSVKEYPIISVSKITTNLTTVLNVKNTNEFTTATVEATTTGLTLTYNGAASTLAFATYTTVTDLNDAINALGSGWVSTMESGKSTVLTSAVVRRYAQEAVNNNQVGVFILGDGFSYQVKDVNAGLIDIVLGGNYYGYYNDSYHSGDGNYNGASQRTHYHVPHGRVMYVNYTAGYATIPEDLKNAMLQFVSYLYNKNDSTLTGVKSYSIEDLSKEFESAGSSDSGVATLPNDVMLVFDMYKRVVI